MKIRKVSAGHNFTHAEPREPEKLLGALSTETSDAIEGASKKRWAVELECPEIWSRRDGLENCDNQRSQGEEIYWRTGMTTCLNEKRRSGKKWDVRKSE